MLNVSDDLRRTLENTVPSNPEP